jgi:hypothetical protein
LTPKRNGCLLYLPNFVIFYQKSKYSFKMIENAKNSKKSKFVRELRLAMEDETARGGGGKVDPCTWTSGIDGWMTTPHDNGPN